MSHSDDENAPKHPFIIKRIKKVHNAHHGGSWKIAYADFVTAMMAFFLLMWLLSLLNKYQLDGISEYFRKPISQAFTETDNSKQRTKPEIYQQSRQTDQPSKLKKMNPLDVMQEMKTQLESKMDKDPQMREYKNLLNFVVTADGLKIELRDLNNKEMFSKGKTDFQEHAKTILNWLSNELNNYPNRVTIVGHTDATPYPQTENYSNWELSADRANATRRALIKYGMNPQKILRVIGSADIDLLDKTNAFDATNRRIEIYVLTDEASKKILND